MNNWAIQFKPTSRVDGGADPFSICIEAEDCQLVDGFFNFYREDKDHEGAWYKFAYYSADTVEFVVEQKEFTEQEVLGQIEGVSNKDFSATMSDSCIVQTQEGMMIKIDTSRNDNQ